MHTHRLRAISAQDKLRQAGWTTFYLQVWRQGSRRQNILSQLSVTRSVFWVRYKSREGAIARFFVDVISVSFVVFCKEEEPISVSALLLCRDTMTKAIRRGDLLTIPKA